MGERIGSIAGNQPTIHSEQTAPNTAPQVSALSNAQPMGQNPLFDNMPTRVSTGIHSGTVRLLQR